VPLVENPDGTLWIGIDKLSEVEAVDARLATLGVPVAALIPDRDCDVPVQEVDWRDLYPKIVPRYGDEPAGNLIQPSEIPAGHTLLLAVYERPGAPDRQVVTIMSLVRGPVPKRVGPIVNFRGGVRPPGPQVTPRAKEPYHWNVRYPGLRDPRPPGQSRES
jgi:hypothetical protein